MAYYSDAAFEKAEASWKADLNSDPYNWALRHNLGLAAAQQEQWGEAVAWIKVYPQIMTALRIHDARTTPGVTRRELPIHTSPTRSASRRVEGDIDCADLDRSQANIVQPKLSSLRGRAPEPQKHRRRAPIPASLGQRVTAESAHTHPVATWL